MEIKEAYRGFNDALQIQKEALENVEEEKVQRNLDGLEKAGFSRNVFYSPLDLNFFNIVFSCIRRNWILWWGPWWTAGGGGGENCSSTVTSTGPMQTLGSTSITCLSFYLCIFSRCFRGKGSNGKDTWFWHIFPHICFIHWKKKYIDPNVNVCLLIMVHVD